MGITVAGYVDAAAEVALLVRVLLVADVSAEAVHGGAERMLVNHMRAIREAGHTPTLLTRQPRADAPLQHDLGEGEIEHRLPFDGNRGIGGLRQLLRGAKAWWPRYREQFDLVVAEQPFTMWALHRAGCRLPRLQVCHSFAHEEYATRHGLDWNLRHQLAASAMRRLEGGVYRSSRSLLVLSGHMQKRLGEVFQIDPARVTVAHGGVGMPPEMGVEDRRCAREEMGWCGPVVVTLRNLVPRTGVDMLVQAAAMLRHEFPALRWCVIGTGPLLQPLRKLAAELDMADRIEFTGYLEEHEVTRRMQAADLFMLPTRSLEGFGLVTPEANACGLPVVATPVGANPEVAGATPYNRLASAISPEALAEAAAGVLREAADHAVRQESLRRHVADRFDWSQHDEAFIRQMQALMA